MSTVANYEYSGFCAWKNSAGTEIWEYGCVASSSGFITIEAGRHLQDHLVKPTLLKAGSATTLQGCLQLGFEYWQEWGLYSLSV